VTVQVLPFQQSTIDSARKRGPLESVAGVGDAAYLYANPAGYAELYVKVGSRLLTLQRSVGMGKSVADVRPGVIALARLRPETALTGRDVFHASAPRRDLAR
jgi:hypothetical protein